MSAVTERPITEIFDEKLSAAKTILKMAALETSQKKKIARVVSCVIPTSTTQIAATLSTGTPSSESAYAVGKCTQKNHPLSCTRETVVFWRRKRYVLTLNIPIPREEENLTQAERDALLKFIEKSKRIFIGELDKATKDDSEIQPGDNFDFLVTEEGFTAYTLTGDSSISFNPEDDSIEHAIASKYFKSHTSVTSDVARKLSEVIQSCNPEQMVKELDQDKVFASYRASPKEAQESEIYTFRPVPLQNFTGTVCYLNTAFQQFASNHAIRQELLTRPELIREEKNSPLYKALKAYDEEQSKERPCTLNLSELKTHLGLDGTEQDDPHVAIQAIQSKLAETEGSKLFSRMQAQVSYVDSDGKAVWKNSGTPVNSMLAQRVIKLEAGKSFKELYAQIDTPAEKTQTTLQAGTTVDIVHKREVYVTEPDIEYIYINRIHTDRTTLSDSGKTAFIEQLKSKGLPADKLDLLFQTDKESFLSTSDPAEKIRLATAILIDDTKFELAFSKLTKEEKQTFYGYTSKIKITDKIDVPLELNGRELCSFGAHDGTDSSGHHYTYVKDGDTYWRLSDADVVQLKDRTEFMSQLKNATSLVYNKKGLTPAPAGSKPAESAVSGELTDIILHYLYNEKTTVKVGVGDITQRLGTIVNFTNPTLDQQTSIYNADLKSVIHALRTNNKNSLTNSQGTYSAGKVVQSVPSKKLKENGVKRIVHAVIDPSHIKNSSQQAAFEKQLKKLVKASLEKAHDGKDKHIAFTLPEGILDALIVPACNAMLAEINSYAKNHTGDLDHFETIEIVLTKEQRDAIVSTSAPKPEAPVDNSTFTTLSTHKLNDNTTLVIGKSPNKTAPSTAPAGSKTVTALFSEMKELFQKALAGAKEIIVDFRPGKDPAEKDWYPETKTAHFSFDPATYGGEQEAIQVFANIMAALANRSSPSPVTLKLRVPEDGSFDSPIQGLKDLIRLEISPPTYTQVPAVGQVAYVGTINEAPFIVETTPVTKPPAGTVFNDEDLGAKIKGYIALVDNDLGKNQEEFIFDLRPGKGQPKIGEVDIFSHNIGPDQNAVMIFFEQLLANCKNPNKKPIRIIMPEGLPPGTLVRINNALKDLDLKIQEAKIEHAKTAIRSETPAKVGNCTFQNGTKLFVEKSKIGNSKINDPLTKEAIREKLKESSVSVTIDLRGTNNLGQALQNFREAMIEFVKTVNTNKVTLIVPKEADENTIQTQLFEIADSRLLDYSTSDLKGKVRLTNRSNDLKVVSTTAKKTNGGIKKTPMHVKNNAPAARLISDIKTKLTELESPIPNEIILDIRPGDADTTPKGLVSLDLRDYEFENPEQALESIIKTISDFKHPNKRTITLILPEDRVTRVAVAAVKKAPVEGLMFKPESEANKSGGLGNTLYNAGASVWRNTLGRFW